MVPELESVVKIARDAGQDILGVSDEDVEQKEDGTPLTRADMASHRRITEELSNLSPHPIMSEEGHPGEFLDSPPEVYWLVDPLDGTKEFVKGNGEYTVNIALIRNFRPVLGVIHPPELGWVCQAVEGKGAWWQEGDGEPEKITADRPEGSPMVAAVSRSHPSKKTEAFLADNGIEKRLELGSSLKFCAIARGQADVYPRPNPTCLWDTGAGTIIAREAGCSVKDLSGSDLLHNPEIGIKHHGFVVRGPRMNG
ncbi:MAG: 3'(2'),5'-bisphosphate nucleotidase CysQ family protein [Planctomycetota bacterium]